MKTNEIKKGMVVKLKNGWFGIMADNMRGNTRMVDVDGAYREIGSVYSHDIVKAWKTNIELGGNIMEAITATRTASDNWEWVEYTKSQLKLKEQVKAMGF
tara:strand:- start:344 stop:643 length:300 start_codon:yes stop_codon:yes gene_type:complete